MYSTERDMSDVKVSVLHTLGNEKFRNLFVSQEFLLDTLDSTPQTSICTLVNGMGKKKKNF